MFLRILISSLLLQTWISAAPPYDLQFGQRLDLEEDFFITGETQTQPTFVQLSNNPKVSILQAPITSSFVPKNGQSLSDILNLNNVKHIQQATSSPSLISSTVHKQSSGNNVETNAQKLSSVNTKLLPNLLSLMQASTENVLHKQSSISTDSARKKNLNSISSNVNTIGNSLSQGRNKNNANDKVSDNIKVVNLGNLNQVKQYLQKLNLSPSKNLVSTTLNQPTTKNNKLPTKPGIKSKPVNPLITTSSNNIKLQNTVSPMSNEEKRKLTIGEYLLSLNGKNGIVVLPLTTDFNQKHTASETQIKPVTPKPDVMTQLKNYVLQQGLVDDLKIELQHTNAIPKQSEIQVRQTESITTPKPEIFRRTLADLFFVKGQWIGTLIGGVIDIGEVFIDAFKKITSGSKSKL